MVTSNVQTRRDFVNVGQALFAIEEHNGKTIVYDCGGESRQTVSTVLPYVLKKNDQIDILFISHYDKDHINGIPALLQYCNVKHIVLPMIEHATRIMSLLYLPHNSFEYEFTLNPTRTIRGLLNMFHERYRYLENDRTYPYIHFVAQADGDNSAFSIESPVLIGNMGDNQIILPYRAVRIDNLDDWIYVPYNRRLMTKNEEMDFYNLLGVPFGCSEEEFLDHWKHNWPHAKIEIPYWNHPYYYRNIVKEAWAAATNFRKGINDYSMTLYSGHAYNKAKDGCLYTGDYNAHKYIDELKRFYMHVEDQIGIVQIPHHGSRNNYDPQLIIPSATHVISNKEIPHKRSDVKYDYVWNDIERKGEKVVGTWNAPLYLNMTNNNNT